MVPGNQRTLNVSRQPMVPLVPMLPLVKTLVPIIIIIIIIIITVIIIMIITIKTLFHEGNTISTKLISLAALKYLQILTIEQRHN